MATKNQTIKAQQDIELQLARQELAGKTGEALEVLRDSLRATFEVQAKLIHHYMKEQGFWESENTGEKIALMHSELSEALEADRKGLTSEHIPEYSGIEEELADVLIRIFDFAGFHELQLADAFVDKMHFNLTRPYKHGKAY